MAQQFDIAILAEVTLGARHWLGGAVLLSAVTLAMLVWSYRRGSARSWVRGLAALLKGIAVVALAVCLVEPLFTGTRPRPGSNLFLVVADNSRSLKLSDGDTTASRGQSMQRLLADESTWLTRLAQDFDVRRYVFDTNLRPAKSFSALTIDGEASAMNTALAALVDRFRGQPVAGILLLKRWQRDRLVRRAARREETSAGVFSGDRIRPGTCRFVGLARRGESDEF